MQAKLALPQPPPSPLFLSLRLNFGVIHANNATTANVSTNLAIIAAIAALAPLAPSPPPSNHTLFNHSGVVGSINGGGKASFAALTP